MALSLALPAFAGTQEEEVETTTTETMKSSTSEMSDEAQMEEEAKKVESSNLPATEGEDAQLQQAPAGETDSNIDSSSTEETKKVEE